MDRRLPVRPAPYFVQRARRRLLVEQRLDMIGRPQTQRFFNPPCCADVPTTFTITTTTPLVGEIDGNSSEYYAIPFEGEAVSFTITADVQEFDQTVEVRYGEFILATATIPAGQTSATVAIDPPVTVTDLIIFIGETPGTANLTAVITMNGTGDNVTVPWDGEAVFAWLFEASAAAVGADMPDSNAVTHTFHEGDTITQFVFDYGFIISGDAVAQVRLRDPDDPDVSYVLAESGGGFPSSATDPITIALPVGMGLTLPADVIVFVRIITSDGVAVSDVATLAQIRSAFNQQPDEAVGWPEP